MFGGSHNLCPAHCWIYKYDKQVVTELQYKVMYYMQIIKDLVLVLEQKIPLLQLITQQYSDNEFGENIFSLQLGRFTWELSKDRTYISKAFKCQLQHGGGGLAEAKMPQKPCKCYIVGFSVLLIMEK